jgi:choline-sulfatase
MERSRSDVTRPNILLVMVDQLAAPFLRPYGDTTMLTPAIDQLAAHGVVYQHAYSNSPLCAPARFAMLTGRRNSAIGAYDNASELSSSIPTLAHHLRAAGYQTSLIGKMHFVGADQLHGYEERLTTDIYPADFGWTPDWNAPDVRFGRWYHDMGSVLHAGVVEASNQLDFDDDVGFQALRKIRDLARATDPRPWFVTVSFTHPHDPYVARREYWNRYDPGAIPMPATGPIVESGLDPHSRRLRHVIAADTTEVTDDQIRDARHAYYANTAYVDDHIGELTGALERIGMADDTVILFTADHGDMLGERGLWYKMNFFEHASRVPLVIHSPGRLAPGVATTPVSLLDVVPTLLGIAGIELDDEAADSLDGDSLLSYATTDDPERAVYGEYLAEGAIAPMFMIRRGRWKYIWSEPDPPLLFDLENDPAELVNLAESRAHEQVERGMRAEVVGHWDVEAIDAAVRNSQRDRSLVAGSLRQGRPHPWDWQPETDAANQYMRNHLDLNEVEASRRL